MSGIGDYLPRTCVNGSQVVPNTPANPMGMGGLGCACEIGLGCACDGLGRGGSSSSGGKYDEYTGMGLFDSGMDFTQWGVAEWAVVALGGYMVLSTITTTQRGVRSVRKATRRRRNA